jgi:hypothetical protein
MLFTWHQFSDRKQKAAMKKGKDNQRPQQTDRHLKAPSEANRDKHINFIKEEEESERLVNYKEEDKFSEKRQEQWQQGIEEGERAKNISQKD